MKKILKPISIILLFFSVHLPINAQYLSAEKHLNILKNGVLLVKLYTKYPLIDALRERGNNERADIMEKEQAFKNKKIVKAFETNYNFSPIVYFFYSEDSQKIKDRDFEGSLMGYDLKIMDSVEIGPDFYIAEFGSTENMDVSALVIKDNQGNYLSRPFPYFVRTFEDFWIFERRIPLVVQIWNDKLHNAFLHPIRK